MLFFTGKDWDSDEAENYKKLITDKIASFVNRPIVIGSLTTFLEIEYKDPAVFTSGTWFLLLDIHRAVLYDDDFSDKHARIKDISHFVNDVTASKHLDLINLFGLKHPVVPTGFDRILNILPLFLKQKCPGWAADFNTVTGVINYARASKHPQTKSVQSELNPEELKIESRQIGTNGRSFAFRKIEPDISTESNIIRLSDLRMNELSIPAGRSMVVWREGEDKFICGGKSVVPEVAELISLCESLERFQVMYHSPETKLMRCSFNELGEKAVNPYNLFFNTRNSTFDPDEPIYWTEVFDLTGRNRKFAPAQEIWFDTALLKDEKTWVTNTTNGCAVGASFEEALLFAILEAVERDSFLTCWYLRKPCRRLESSSLDNEQLHLLISKLKYLKPNYEITFLDLRNDLNIPSVLVTAVRKSGVGPKFFCAVASALDYAGAAFSALKDIQNLLSFPPTLDESQHFRMLLSEQNKIMNPEEHQGIYTFDELYEKVAFFDSGETVERIEFELYELTNEKEKSYDVKAIIERLETNCRQVGVTLYCRDISHQSLKEKNLRCVKVIGEHLFPIWYGYYNNRISLNKRLTQISLLENGKKISSEDDLNTDIHPFG